MSLPLPPSALRLGAAQPPPALRRSTSSALSGRHLQLPPIGTTSTGTLQLRPGRTTPTVLSVSRWGVVGAMKGRGSMQDRHPFPRYAKRHHASCDGEWGAREDQHTHTGPAQCGRVPSSMSWCPFPRTLHPRAGVRQVHHPTRRTSPQVRPPSHGQACHSCNFVLAC